MALTELSRKPLPDAQGELVTYQGTDPAAGAEFSELVPARKYWRIQNIRAPLVTSAVVANRRVRVILEDAGPNVLHQANDESVQAASLTNNYNIAPQNSRPVQDVEHYIPIPFPEEGFILPPGGRVRSSTLLLDAGDNWGAPIITVEEITY